MGRVELGVWECDTSCMDRLCCWESERGCWVYGWLSGAATGGGVGGWVVGEEVDAVGWLGMERREFIRVGVGKQGVGNVTCSVLVVGSSRDGAVARV